MTYFDMAYNQLKQSKAMKKGKGQASSWPMLLLGLSAAVACVMPVYVMILGLPEPAHPYYLPQSHLTPHPRKVDRPRQGLHFHPGVLEADGRALGEEEAPNVVVEFTDFLCTHCQEAHRVTVLALLHHYLPSRRVRIESHPVAFLGSDSLRAAHAALCAQEQHKYWEMRELLFQVELPPHPGASDSANSSASQTVFTASLLKKLASIANMDSWAFVKCFREGRYVDEVHRISQLARTMGVLETPTFIINHKKLGGVIPVMELYAMLR